EVVAATTVEDVVTRLAVQLVGPWTAREDVVAVAAERRVVAGHALELVVAALALELVVLGGALHVVRLVGAVEGLRLRGERHRESKRHDGRRDHERATETEHAMTLTRHVLPAASIPDFSGAFHPFGQRGVAPSSTGPRLGP